jgi:hypothetical protein
MTAQAQLAVSMMPVKMIGQKAVVPLTLANHLPAKIESARAACFLLDDQGKIIGQASKWVIGQDKSGLASGATNTFNFVITSPHPFSTTNLTAKVAFSRVLLAGDKPVDVRQSVTVTAAVK